MVSIEKCAKAPEMRQGIENAPRAGRHPDKPKTKDAYVTNRERAQAEQPKILPAWKFQSGRKEKYNPISVSDAFDAYQQRVKTKKWAEPKIATTTHKKRVTINETATEIVHEGPKLQKLRVTNRRNDEIKIDNCKEAEPIDDVIQKKTPGFYGTMEAEQAAEAVAVHLSYAGDNMERLRFVTEAVYPQATEHLDPKMRQGTKNASSILNCAKDPKMRQGSKNAPRHQKCANKIQIFQKKIREIEDDVKDFNTQMRGHRVKMPTSAVSALY
uniref:Reverse transcriptase domain-containing protein n=1 Tax=Caenorhabditis tropicalis TaxID=1561998 RepID=A0A1I7T6B5_9PELO